jgi:hypothetical protein
MPEGRLTFAHIWESQHLATLICLHLLFLFVALGLWQRTGVLKEEP